MKLFIALALITSFSASAGVELYRQESNSKCVITKNKVTKTVTVFNATAGATVTTAIDTFGIEELGKKAHSLSSNRPSNLEGYEMKVIVDGDAATLSVSDSREATHLMALMVKICN